MPFSIDGYINSGACGQTLDTRPMRLDPFSGPESRRDGAAPRRATGRLVDLEPLTGRASTPTRLGYRSAESMSIDPLAVLVIRAEVDLISCRWWSTETRVLRCDSRRARSRRASQAAAP